MGRQRLSVWIRHPRWVRKWTRSWLWVKGVRKHISILLMGIVGTIVSLTEFGIVSLVSVIVVSVLSFVSLYASRLVM